MNTARHFVIGLLTISLLVVAAPYANAVILPTAPVAPTAPTALMLAPTPTTVAPGIGGIGLWPTALMLPTTTPTVPTIGATFPALMTAPIPTTTTPTFGGGFGITPLMLAPTTPLGGTSFWPSFPTAPTPTTTTFPALMTTVPTFAPTPSPTFAASPLMFTPTTFGGGGISFWPTAIMLPTTAPAPTTGALFPAAMLPVI